MKAIPSRAAVMGSSGEFRTAVARAVRLVLGEVPGLTAVNVCLVVVQGLLPLAALYVMKVIIDTVTAGASAVEKDPVIAAVLVLVAAAAAIALLVAVARALSTYTAERQSLVLTDIVMGQVHAHSVRLDMAYYEDPAYWDTLHRAQAEGPYRVGKIVDDLVQVGQNGLSLVAVGGFIVLFSPVVGLVLICAGIPAAVAQVWFSRRLYDLRLEQTGAERKAWYYHEMITGAEHAPEVRQFGLGPLFRGRYDALRESLRTATLAVSRSRASWAVVTQGLVTAAVFGSFAVVALMAVQGELSIGDMVAFFAGFQLCIGYTQSIFSSLNALYEDQLFLRNLFEFLDLEPTVAAPAEPAPLPAPFAREVRFEDVSFAYPGAARPRAPARRPRHPPGRGHRARRRERRGEEHVRQAPHPALRPDLGPGHGRRRRPRARPTPTRGGGRRPSSRRTTSGTTSPRARTSGSATSTCRPARRASRRPRARPPRTASSGASRTRTRPCWGRCSRAGTTSPRASGRRSPSPAPSSATPGSWSSTSPRARSTPWPRPRSSTGSGSSSGAARPSWSATGSRRSCSRTGFYVFDRGEVVERGTHAELMAMGGRYARMFLAQAGPYR